MGIGLSKPALDAGLVTREAEPLLAFYVEVFGLERLDPLVLPNIGTIHKLAAGESILRVMVPETLPEPDDAESWSGRTGIRYLTLEVDDVAATALAVEAKGGKVVLPPFELRPGRFVSQATDPDGNMLEIGQG